ncbi:hypothetical protein [Frankia sp. AgW1.1]|uniref:hypothetical protein n=1 Tax=Frankia sp. AgW1.1 TaxID=1836971 RepID=UPI0019327D78|nr:hypothetical protein [Frankia sp. AgW1.1]MBL7487048.1 hypothetical protein [Frankia sp. AgW1.1]
MTDWTQPAALATTISEPDPVARLEALAIGLAQVEAFAKAIRETRDQAIKEARAIPGEKVTRPRHTIPDLAKAARITETAVKAILR